MKHLKYVWYIIKHKWFVMIECFKVGLFIEGITHDLSKFLPDEWFPYVDYFYGDLGIQNKCPARGSEPKVMGISKKFDFAWLLHQKRNPHHWQWWLLLEDKNETKIFDMPLKYRKEMLCDWRGAGKAQGHGNNTKGWYEKNKDKMKLHMNTREWIENNI